MMVEWTVVVTLVVTTVTTLCRAVPLRLRRPQQQDSCDWTVWDSTWEDKGVHNVHARCSEGRIQWHDPFGAIRISFTPSLDQGRPFEACFLASANAVPTKISIEKSESLQPLIVLNQTRETMPRELCFRSLGNAVTLYVEADSRSDPVSVGVVEIDYDVQKLPSWPGTDAHYDDMEECRPCTDKELLEAVCSSDFVVQGSIHHVVNDPDFSETRLHLVAERIIRQSQEVFTISKDPFLSSRQLADTPIAIEYTGSVIAPQKCGIRKGMGQFLFVGKVRLKRAVLKCAPRLEDFQEVWQAAARTGRNPCVLE